MTKMKIPSPIHEGNIQSTQQEDQEPPPPSNTDIIEQENEIDILYEGFQEGMIFSLRGIEDNPCEESNQEEEGIEQPTIPDWLKERMKIKAPMEVQEEDLTTDFLAKLGKVAVGKTSKRFSMI